MCTASVFRFGMKPLIRCALFLFKARTVGICFSFCLVLLSTQADWYKLVQQSTLLQNTLPATLPVLCFVTNVASKLLWQAVILQDPSWCTRVLNILSLTPGAPSYLSPSVIVGRSCAPHSEKCFHFTLCLNQVQSGGKTHDRQSLPYLQLHSTHAI